MSPLATALVLMAFFAAFGWVAWWICSAECSRLGARVLELVAENDEFKKFAAVATTLTATDDQGRLVDSVDCSDLRRAETPGDIGWQS